MAVTKSRLGRGLGSLISGGISSSPPARSPAKAEKKKDKGKKKDKSGVGRSAPAKSVPAKKASPAKKSAAAPAPKKAKVPARAREKPAPEVSKELPEGTIPLKQKAEAEALASVPAPETAPPPPVDAVVETVNGMRELPVDKVFPNPHQPRRDFADEGLKELAESIRAEGLLQPIVVRSVKEGFQLIAGERRWRACKAIGMRRITARVMEVSEASAAVLTMIENLQRADLNPIEEALGFASLMRDFDLTQESVAERVGKARASVANALRLLQLDREIQGFLAKGLLSVGHAKVILGLEDPEQRRLLARQIIERGASVREAERLVQMVRRPAQPLRDNRPAAAPEAELAAVADFQRRMASYLNTPVRLKHAPKKGQIVIEYFGNDDLQRIFERMGLGPS